MFVCIDSATRRTRAARRAALVIVFPEMTRQLHVPLLWTPGLALDRGLPEHGQIELVEVILLVRDVVDADRYLPRRSGLLHSMRAFMIS